MGLAGCSAQRSQSMTAQGAQERGPWVQGSCVLGKHWPLSRWGLRLVPSLTHSPL